MDEKAKAINNMVSCILRYVSSRLFKHLLYLNSNSVLVFLYFAMKSDEKIAEFLGDWNDLPSKLLNNTVKPISLHTESFGKITSFLLNTLQCRIVRLFDNYEMINDITLLGTNNIATQGLNCVVPKIKEESKKKHTNKFGIIDN